MDFDIIRKERNVFIKKYNDERKLCPNCGHNECSITLVGYILIHGEFENYKDENICTCLKCGNKHIFHDRLPML